MIETLARISRVRHERAVERRYQRSWDRAAARAGSDSHLDEINALFATRATCRSPR
jgi:hypothetical protein